ncbi:P-loop NTPase fold protein, partial [Lentzea aerocolonigenes]|uniref:P-loop NTPase fold protein n=1 Tax=Lentzea aerocolonigenes TaxID=68170 RepID=UPI0022AA33E8
MAGRRLAVLFAGAEYTTELASFPFAAKRAERLSEALQRFGYDCQTHLNHTSREIRESVRSLIATTVPGDAVIVYVLAHAVLDSAGTVHVVGSDGRPGTEDLQAMATSEPEPGRAPALFLLDLASAAALVADDVDQFVEAPALIIAAETPWEDFRGDFSSAAANVINELADGTEIVSSAGEYIPLTVVAREIQRWLNDRSAAPERTFTTIADAGEDLPFFPNPRYQPEKPPLRESLRGERANSVAVTEVNGSVMFAAGTTLGLVLCDVDGVPVNHVVTAAQYSVATIPGMNAILCGAEDGAVTVRSLPELDVQAQAQTHIGKITGVAAAIVGGPVLAASVGEERAIRVWDAQAPSRPYEQLRPESGLVGPLRFAVGANTRPLLVCGTSDGIQAWDLDTFTTAWRISLGSPVHDIAAGFAVGRQVLVSVQDDGSFTVLDQDNGDIIGSMSSSDNAYRSVALVDEGTAVAGGRGGRIDVIDLRAARIRPLTDLGAGEIWSLALYDSANGPAIVAATDDGVRTVPLGPTPPPPVPRGYAGYVPDVETGVDRLGITGEVHTLCDLVLAREIAPPLSIGLFGDWGTGKSFFMEQMRDRIGRLTAASQTAGLEGRDSALCSQVCQIKFNAWHYIDVDLWASLAATIFDQLAAADASTVSRKVLKDLPSVRKAHEDLRRRQEATRELLKATDEELKAETPIRVGEVITTDTVRKAAREAASKVDEALEKAGVPKDKVTGLDLREVASTAGTLSQNLRFVFQRTGWPLRLLLIVGLVLVVAGPLVVGAFFGDELGTLRTTLASYAVFGVGALLLAKPLLNRAARAVNLVKDLVTSVDDQRRAPVEARRDTLRHRMVEIDQEMLGLNAQVKALHRGSSISAFAMERTESDNYRSHEGMVATLRRDLEEMSRRLTATTKNGQSADLERIILYVDDLDRCPPRRVVELLQAIHLLLAFPLFVVVVGVDSRWL